MKEYIKQIADGRLTRGEVIKHLKNWSKDSVKDFLDGMVADAIAILMDGGNTPANQVKSNRLSDMVDFIATELLPNYDKLRKPIQPASMDKKIGEGFMDCFLVQDYRKEDLLKKLHLLIDGKKGKAVALVIHLCVDLGLMYKPTFSVLLEEFPGIGNKSGYNAYFRGYPARYTEQEINGIKANLIAFNSN